MDQVITLEGPQNRRLQHRLYIMLPLVRLHYFRFRDDPITSDLLKRVTRDGHPRATAPRQPAELPGRTPVATVASFGRPPWTDAASSSAQQRQLSCRRRVSPRMPPTIRPAL